MADESVRFTSNPNELRAAGREEMEAIALSLTIDKGGVVVEARLGTFTKREVELTYGQMSDVEVTEAISFGLVFYTPGTTYTVTNVTSDRREADEMAEFVLGQIRRASGTEQTNAGGANGGRNTASAPTDGGQESAPDATEQIQKWAQLHEQGIISDEEFEQKKRDLL